jgi:hypothetical protein
MLVNGDMGSVETFIKGPIESSPYNLDTCPIINDPNKGLLNYRRTICASKSYLDETDLYVILGDVVYPETNSDKVKPNVPVSDEENKNRLIKMRNKLQNQEIYKGRLICGWAGLKSLLVNYHNICGESSNPEVFRYDQNLNFPLIDLIYGNHSFDVDIELETEIMRELSDHFGLPVDEKIVNNYNNIVLQYKAYDEFYNQNARELSKEEMLMCPKISQYIKNGLKIQFIDFDSMILQCSYSRTEEQYKNCIKIQGLDKLTAFHSFQQSQIYMVRTMTAFKLMDQNADWRIIRIHHPIFNLQGKDTYQLWHDDFIHQGKNYGTLFDAIKKANFHFILASHSHLANILAFPYKRGVNYLQQNFDLEEPKVVESGCFDKFNYYINNQEIDENYNMCLDSPKNYTWSINKNLPEYLWQFNMGNTGKKFDTLFEDQKTRGVLIWGRANYVNDYEAFGGFYFNFTKDEVNVKYIELNSFEKPKIYDNITQDNEQFFINNTYNFRIVLNDKINYYPNIDKAVTSKISQKSNMVVEIIFGISVVSLLIIFVIVYTIHFPRKDFEMVDDQYYSLNN